MQSFSGTSGGIIRVMRWSPLIYSTNLTPQLGQNFGWSRPRYNFPKYPLHEGQRHSLKPTNAANINESVSKIRAVALDLIVPSYWASTVIPTNIPPTTATRVIFARRIANSAIIFFIANVFINLLSHSNPHSYSRGSARHYLLTLFCILKKSIRSKV